MSPSSNVGLPEALERAASALSADADAIRPANGDPGQLLELLDGESAARVLEWLLRHEPDAGSELAIAWADDPETGADPLLRLKGESLPKNARKVLRRAQHHLRSRGVEVPTEKPRRVVATLPAIDDGLRAALLSPIDGRGSRLAFVIEPHPSGGARLFEIMLDEMQGVVGFEVYTAGRSKVRGFMREVTRRDRAPAAEVPLEAVQALIRRIEGYQAPDRPLPRGFSEWRARLAEPPEGAVTPGELARDALGDDSGKEGVDRAVALLREHAIGPWPPSPEALEPLAERIAEIGRGRIVVAAQHRRAQADEVLREAVSGLFGATAGERTAERFEEAAFVFWKVAREDDARACLAAARVFRDAPPEDNPVAMAMLEIVLAPALSKLEEESETEDKDSVLVKP